MIRLLMLGGLVYFIYRFGKSAILSNMNHKKNDPFQADDIMIRDPYCQVYFPKKDGVLTKIKGQSLYFCCEDCKKQYIKKLGENANRNNI